MDEKFIVKTKKFNTWIRSELRFLPEGISIVNEYKSILIKYNELTGLNLDDNLFLTLVYTKMTPSGKFFGNEQIECNEKIIKDDNKLSNAASLSFSDNKLLFSISSISSLKYTSTSFENTSTK